MLLQLAWAFIKIGLFAIGGGLATLPSIYQLSRDTGWVSSTDISNMIAVAESTPGPIGINMATYVGYLTAGVPGAFLAPLALTLPSVLVCLSIAKVLDKVKTSPLVQSVFASLRPASAGLIFATGLGLALNTYWGQVPQGLAAWLTDLNWSLLGLSAALLLIYKTSKCHPILLIVLAAVAGMVLKL